MGQANELQLLVNQEARATSGCFWTTNLGALSVESGLQAATAQLDNRQRRFGLRLLNLPQGDQAQEIVGAPTTIGRRLTNALAYAERTESKVLLEDRKPSTRNCYKRRRPRPMRKQRRNDQDSPYSPTGHCWTAVWQDTRGVEERPDLGGHQNPHGLEPGGL